MVATDKTWELGTVNDFMAALDGFKVTETSLRAVRYHLAVFTGTMTAQLGACDVDSFFSWYNDPKSKTKIKFYDQLCGFERTADVAPYGFKQGYLSIDKCLTRLKTDGVVQIPFASVYDIRQSMANRVKGCYMQISKI